MRYDHEQSLQALERDLLIRYSEKERELIVLKSEVIRSHENKEDHNVNSKKLAIKLE